MVDGEGGKISYGWQRPDMSVHFPRSVTMDFTTTAFRGMGEASASLSARYPDTSWRALNIVTCMFQPGSR